MCAGQLIAAHFTVGGILAMKTDSVCKKYVMYVCRRGQDFVHLLKCVQVVGAALGNGRRQRCIRAADLLQMSSVFCLRGRLPDIMS